MRNGTTPTNGSLRLAGRGSRVAIASRMPTGISSFDQAGGEVLMGTMRWQKEVAERNERAESAKKLAQLQREAEYAAAETRTRLSALQIELGEREAAIKALRDEQTAIETSFESAQEHLRRLRTADAAPPRAVRTRRNGATEASR